MKIRFRQSVLKVILCLLVASCARTQSIHEPLASIKSKPSKTPDSASEQVVVTSSDKFCEDTREIMEIYTSPDERWVAAICYWGNEEDEASYLQITGLDNDKEWRVYFRDYQNHYDRKDIVFPIHWSNDSRFLYVAAHSRLSGCCWVGGRNVLLIQLNLESGEQIEIINSSSPDQYSPFDVKFTESGRYLLFTPSTLQPYDFTILDLTSWHSEFITLKLDGEIDLYYAVISPDESKMIFPLYILREGDFHLDSIGMIDFVSGEQKILLSGLNEETIIYPVHWVDDENVLVSNTSPYDLDVEFFQKTAEYWLLNIYFGTLEKSDAP